MHLVKPELVLRFLEGIGSITSFWFSKYNTLNGFYRYALAREYCSSCPLPLSVPQKPEPFEPYIYTNRDIEQLIVAADAQRQRYYFGRGIEPHTIRTLLLLLYGTGLRISEALSLALSDFDTDGTVLTIRQIKFFKSRFVPVGPDLSGVLHRYIDRQWSGRLCTEATPLLGNRKGDPSRAARQNSSSRAFVNKQASIVRRMPGTNRDCTISGTLSQSFASLPGTAKARTSSGSCPTCLLTSDMAK